MADLPDLPPGQRWLHVAVNVPDPGRAGYDRRLVDVIRKTVADAAEEQLRVRDEVAEQS